MDSESLSLLDRFSKLLIVQTVIQSMDDCIWLSKHKGQNLKNITFEVNDTFEVIYQKTVEVVATNIYIVYWQIFDLTDISIDDIDLRELIKVKKLLNEFLANNLSIEFNKAALLLQLNEISDRSSDENEAWIDILPHSYKFFIKNINSYTEDLTKNEFAKISVKINEFCVNFA